LRHQYHECHQQQGFLRVCIASAGHASKIDPIYFIDLSYRNRVKIGFEWDDFYLDESIFC
jgi:hypothetical protein